jgi:acyl-CoA thioester hydrolase
MKHYTRIQIRFADIDKMGHVNNATYLSYFELARMNYFQEVIQKEIDWMNRGFILATSTVTYLMPVLLEDVISIKTKVSKMGSKSFEMVYSVVKIKDGKETEVSNGSSVLVCYNYTEQKTIEIPTEWVRIIQEYEGSLDVK